MNIRGMNFGWLYKSEFKETYIIPEFDDSELEIVELNDDERVFIKFHGMMAYGKVYLNGNYLGEHKSGYTSFRIDVSESIKRKNCLVVNLDSSERRDMPPFGLVIDYLTYGGIYREVEIQIANKIHIKHAFIKPKNVLKIQLSIWNFILVKVIKMWMLEKRA